MLQNFGTANWRKFIPTPVCTELEKYNEFYYKAWELAFEHIKAVDGMPQTPYMDEAFCETQIWIWDTCFMSLFCKFAREVFPGVESLRNFYQKLYGGKSLGKVIPSEKEPEWTGAKAGVPFEMQIHIADNPPLFAWAEYENALMKGNKDYLKTLLYDEKFLQKHYEWFENIKEPTAISGVMAPTCLIAEPNGYRWEGGRSGMDNTPRGRTGTHAAEQRPNNPDMLWFDAICQQALTAKIIARLFALLGDDQNKAVWQERFTEKAQIINRLYWSADDNFYYDIDCNTGKFYKIATIASFWPLIAEVADKSQAKALLKELYNPKTFGGRVPFVSLSRSDADYSKHGNYWRGSVWLPTAYATLKGLENYGFYNDAHSLSCTLLEHMYQTYKQFLPHTIWECYSPEEFSPAVNEYADGSLVRPDFCGWSALGPIAVYIEFVLGFHTIDAFCKVVKWAKPDLKGEIGIKNLRFGKNCYRYCGKRKQLQGYNQQPLYIRD